jgi:hypothetical protein
VNKLLVVSLLVLQAFAAGAQKTGVVVAEIDKEVQKIDEAGFSRIDTVKFECPERPDYGILRFCYREKELLFIELQSSDQSHSDQLNAYYIRHDSLIFCRMVSESWYFHGQPPDTGRADADEFRHEYFYYVKADKAVSCSTRTYVTFSDPNETANPAERELRETDCLQFEEYTLAWIYELIAVHALAGREPDPCILDTVDKNWKQKKQ